MPHNCPELLSRYGHKRSKEDSTHYIPRDLALSDPSESGLAMQQHSGFESSDLWRADKPSVSH